MTPTRTAALVLAAALLPGVAGASGGPAPQAPPPPAEDAVPGPAPRTPRAATTLWSHGDPSDEEQLLLELMNRARRDPDAEAERVFDDYGDPDITGAVDYFLAQRPGVEWTRAENRAAFRSYPARPPFAFHAALLASSRKHTARMVAAGEQSHELPGEPSLGARVRAEGYSYLRVGESIYAFGRSMLEAHAAFAIDWAQPVPRGETRPSLGHRNALMDFDGTRSYVEAGCGVATETDGATRIGPKVVTIDFGEPADDGVRYVTGVCFADADGDRFYDPGEGLPGVRISTPASAWHTVSSASGGYALPVPADAGAIEVTASGDPDGPAAAVGEQTFAVTVSGANVKLDVSPLFGPPVPAPRSFPRTASVALAPAATTEDAVDVPAFDASSDDVGDVDVRVAFTHPDASVLRISLVSPSGREAVVWDRGPALADLSGEFDTTLSADLRAFVGEPYAGTWRLRVEDGATGGARSLDSWELRVRPAWVRPLHAARSILGVRSLRVSDGPGPGADRVRISGSLDAGGTALDPSGPFHLRLLGPGAEHLRTGPVGAESARVAFAAKGTSRATFSADLAGLDLGGLPEDVTVEVALGGAVGRETVRLRRGTWDASASAPLPGHLRITSMRSGIAPSGTRTTVVRGRIGLAPADVAGGIEVAAGDVRATLRSVARAGTRLRATARAVVRRVEIDTRTGRFVVRIAGEHRPLVDGIFPLALRVGDGQYLETAVRPAGTTALRY